MLPIFHASGFSWDEGLVLVVAIAFVPVLSFIIDRRNKRRAEAAGEAPATTAADEPDSPAASAAAVVTTDEAEPTVDQP